MTTRTAALDLSRLTTVLRVETLERELALLTRRLERLESRLALVSPER